MIYPIGEDKSVNMGADNLKVVAFSNDFQTMTEIVLEEKIESFPTPITDDYFVATLVSGGKALYDENGVKQAELSSSFSTSTLLAGKYICKDKDAIYDLKGTKVYDLKENSATYTKMGEILFITSMADNGDAKYELALAYGQGRGTLGDPALAYRWAKAAAEHDYVDDAAGLVAAMEKGLAGVRVPDLQALEQQAKSGDGKACYRLAFLYEAGLDVEYDADKAFNWYVKALEGGNNGAICRLARLYEAGEGIKADAAFAVKMYGEAANRGELDAAYRLGELSMASGSDENAAKMFAIAAQRDHARAQFQLAKMYIVGRGVEADQAQGLEWLRKAAENGCADARLLLEDIENQD
jgi:TPR repeat protein